MEISDNKINDNWHGTYTINSQIKFKAMMLKSGLCIYSDSYIHVKGTITVQNTAALDADTDNTNKQITFRNCALFTDCTSEIIHKQIMLKTLM